MRVYDMYPMTEGMKRAHGDGWGGFFTDEGTPAWIAQAECNGEPCYVVLGCLDGQWGVEACDEDGNFLDAGYGDTPQDALDDLF